MKPSILVSLALVAACSSSSPPGPAPLVKTQAEDAGSNALVDAGVESGTDAAPAEEAHQAPAIGLACAARTPAPSECADFESATKPYQDVVAGGGALHVDTDGSDSSSRLVASVKKSVTDGAVADGAAFASFALAAPAIDFVSFSFDVRAEPFVPGTEIAALRVPTGPGAWCNVGIAVSDDFAMLAMTQFCTATGVDSPVVAVPLPTSAGWMSVRVDVDFAVHTASLALRTASGAASPAVGAHTLMGAPTAEVQVGITFLDAARPDAAVSIDNVAIAVR